MVNYVVVTGAGGAFWGAEGDYMLGGEGGGGGSHGKGLHGTRTHNGERGGKKKHLACHGKPSGMNRVSPWL